MTRVIAVLICAAFAQAPAPPHVVAIHADLESPAAARAMIVLRAFVERHPGVAAIEFHLAPPRGELRAVDRAVMAAQAQKAGLEMAELILANPGRRTADDLVAMARQLRLDDASFRKALTQDTVDESVAADLATAAAAKPPSPLLLTIDGQAWTGEFTLPGLELRLAVR